MLAQRSRDAGFKDGLEEFVVSCKLGEACSAKCEASAQKVYPPCASPRGGGVDECGCEADASPPSYVWQLNYQIDGTRQGNKGGQSEIEGLQVMLIEPRSPCYKGRCALCQIRSEYIENDCRCESAVAASDIDFAAFVHDEAAVWLLERQHPVMYRFPKKNKRSG